MGTLKDKLIDTEEKWLAKCKIEGWKCKRCGDEIPHGEQEVFSELVCADFVSVPQPMIINTLN